jgi:hypothetical protein
MASDEGVRLGAVAACGGVDHIGRAFLHFGSESFARQFEQGVNVRLDDSRRTLQVDRIHGDALAICFVLGKISRVVISVVKAELDGFGGLLDAAVGDAGAELHIPEVLGGAGDEQEVLARRFVRFAESAENVGCTAGMSSQDTSEYPARQTGRLLSEPATRARLGGISRMTLVRIRERGELPAVHIGRRRFFLVDDVDAYIDRNREAVASP